MDNVVLQRTRNIPKCDLDQSILTWTFYDKVDYIAIADFAFLKSASQYPFCL